MNGIVDKENQPDAGRYAVAQIRMSIQEIRPHVRHVNVSQYQPGQVVGPRKIYDHQFIYVRQGFGAMEIDGVLYPARPGDLYHYGPDVIHRFLGDTAKPFFLWGVHFDFTQHFPELPFPIESFQPAHFKADLITETVSFADFAGFAPHLSLPPDNRIRSLLLDLLHEYDHGLKHHQVCLDGLLTALIALIARYTELGHGLPLGNLSTADDVMTYIQEHYPEDLSNDSIGSHFHFHPAYLNRLVRARTGRSIQQYIIDLRVRKALDLIANTNTRIEQISRAVGYPDAHYFSRLIRKKTGHSPSQLRRQ
jgi:AraC-like DNA-binding protein/quercetin dioxygenase-like cupin family protein